MPGFEDDDDLHDDQPRRPKRSRRENDDEADYDDDRVKRGQYKPHRGMMILVFGILGMMMCGGFGIAAFLMGKRDKREIEIGQMDPEGQSLTQVGYILGIIGCVRFTLELLYIVFWVCLTIIIILSK
ncbi:hypothetical protein [Zavarzinella formosa]|uniref:hypothetical protein n=1 Tax=Zavarzinella formosa TaxID=360055 RepID=UPI0002DD4CD9|nr:hypothetical protein [Zavarzinella formosa]